MHLTHNKNKASHQQRKLPLWFSILHAKIILVWKLHLTISLQLSINFQHLDVQLCIL